MAKKKAETAQAVDLQNFLKEIEIRAFVIYLDRTQNNLPGNEMSDWIEAEKEIKEKYGI